MKSPAPGEEQPQAPRHAGDQQLESHSVKKVLVDSRLRVSTVYFSQRRLIVLLDALGKVFPAGKLRLNPSTKHWRNYTWRIVFSVRLPSNEKIWTYWKESSEGPQRCLRDGVTSPMGKAERAGTVRPREEEAQE